MSQLFSPDQTTRFKFAGTRLTNSTLRQPSQGIDIIPPSLILHHIDLTIIIHIPDNSIQLQRGLNQARQPQHKEYEAADYDNAG